MARSAFTRLFRAAILSGTALTRLVALGTVTVPRPKSKRRISRRQRRAGGG